MARQDEAGFTLIEIMVVIVIITGVLAIGGTQIFNPNEHRRSQVRKVAILTKEIRTSARLQNSTYRIVLEMNKNKENGKDDRYWVESASGQALELSEEKQEELEKLTAIQREEATKGRSNFTKDKRHKEVILDGGLRIEGVEIAGRSKEITDGQAAINFFPQGLSDEAIIKLGDGKSQNWSIVIHPLTGGAEILNRAVTLKELYAQ